MLEPDPVYLHYFIYPGALAARDSRLRPLMTLQIDFYCRIPGKTKLYLCLYTERLGIWSRE